MRPSIRQTPRRVQRCSAHLPSQTRPFTYPSTQSKKSNEQVSVAAYPAAEELVRIEAWRPKQKRLTKRELYETGRFEELTGPLNWAAYDLKRVNIVSDDLCAQSVERLKPSLAKHEGCDLLDINPGAGLWSKHLHDAVKPRRHLMVEGQPKLYQGMIEDQMGSREHEIIQDAGLNWERLGEVMTYYLDPEHERIKPGEEQPVKNDLLVTLNLASWPRQGLGQFKDMNRMTLYQLMASIPKSNLFHRYGSVRFFMWVNDFNKRFIMPRSVTCRDEGPFGYEMSCEHIHEVCGFDEMDKPTRTVTVRDDWINIEGTARALKNMEEKGMMTPPGRETALMKQVLADPSLREPLVGVRMPRIVRTYEDELEGLENEVDLEGSAPSRRHINLRIRSKQVNLNSSFHHEMLQLHTSLLEMDPSDAGYDALLQQYQFDLESLRHMVLSDFLVLRDSYHLWKHQPDGIPALHWDRRPYEPLVVQPEEFFPNVPLALYDVQPKPTDPVINQAGRGSTRSADYAAILLKMIMNYKKIPLYPRMLDSVTPGLGNLAKNQCPSFWDVRQGGNRLPGLAGLNSRTMGANHFQDLMRAWMKWPFRPEYTTFLGKSAIVDGHSGDGDDESHAGRRQNFSA